MHRVQHVQDGDDPRTNKIRVVRVVALQHGRVLALQKIILHAPLLQILHDGDQERTVPVNPIGLDTNEKLGEIARTLYAVLHVL